MPYIGWARLYPPAQVRRLGIGLAFRQGQAGQFGQRQGKGCTLPPSGGRIVDAEVPLAKVLDGQQMGVELHAVEDHRQTPGLKRCSIVLDEGLLECLRSILFDFQFQHDDAIRDRNGQVETPRAGGISA